MALAGNRLPELFLQQSKKVKLIWLTENVDPIFPCSKLHMYMYIYAYIAVSGPWTTVVRPSSLRNFDVGENRARRIAFN